MRIFFFEAPYSYKNASTIVGSYFPLGLGYLAAYARKHGHEVRLFQPQKNASFDETLLGAIRSFHPDVVAVSVMTSSYPEAVRLLGLIKRDFPCTVAVGGHHVSAMKARILDEAPIIDFVVYGEGEETFVELLAFLERRDRQVEEIRGLIWRNAEGKPVENKPRLLLEDLDALPFPARDLVDMNRYRLHSYIDFGKKSATMITSRGCPYKCIFCSSWLTMGASYRCRSAESVLEEVQELVDRYAVDHIVFEDDTMTLRRDRMMQICRGLQNLKRRPSWYCLSRVNTMDEEMAMEMKRAGCRMVNFGIESGSPEILEKIGKKINLNQAVKAVQACTRAGLRTQCTFIVGFPFDTKETMNMTLQAAIAINPTLAIFFPLTPYPGTRVYDEFMDPALLPNSVDAWRDFVVVGETDLVRTNPHYGGRQIRALAQRWNRRYYFRPNHIRRILRTVSSPKELYRVAIAGFYLLLTCWRRG
jgi:anaerobic magnesium-protoporphyrin IX monomethyl ester cyclase